MAAALRGRLLEAHDFSGITRVDDLGGAHGSMAAAIAKRYPTLRCTCFDFSSAEQGALKTFRDQEVSDRCDFIGGDFFEDVPACADAYLIRPSYTTRMMDDACRSSVTAGAESQVTADF
jgi:hypothetical protein